MKNTSGELSNWNGFLLSRIRGKMQHTSCVCVEFLSRKVEGGIFRQKALTLNFIILRIVNYTPNP